MNLGHLALLSCKGTRPICGPTEVAMSSILRFIVISILALLIGISLFNAVGCSNYPGDVGGGGGANGGGGGIGGGGTPTPTPTPTPTSSATPQQSSLKGSYAFHVWGSPLASAGGGTFYGMVGSFTSDGSGNITSGNEEVYIVDSSHSLSRSQQNLAITGGSYTINGSGVGQVSLTAANPTYSAVLGIVLITPAHALITRLDNQAVTYGSADLQDTTAFASTAIASTSYVFDGLGVDDTTPSPTTIAHAGIFTTDSAGTGTTDGVQDINDNGTLVTDDTLIASSLVPPNTSNGRMAGSITDGLVTFATTFYIVN